MIGYRRSVTCVLLGLAMVLSAPPGLSATGLEKGITGLELKSLTENYFDDVRLTADDDGDPIVVARHEGNRFLIIGLDCDKAAERSCNVIVFFAFTLNTYTPQVLGVVNTINKDMLSGAAVYENGKHVIMRFCIHLKNSTLANVGLQMENWRTVLPIFVNHSKAFAPYAEKTATGTRNATITLPVTLPGASGVVVYKKTYLKALLEQR